MANNDVRVRASVDDKISAALERIRDKFDTLGKGAASASLIGNVGANVLAGAWGAVDRVMAGVVNIVGDANQAYLEEERSVAKLDASLRANIVGWNGNRDAIEGVLKSRMSLGFSDEEQRDSLARLVAATHDVNQALAIERTAMDLARFKGISLADATEALTKVEAGSYRILKSLGIQLRDGATQTEALAAVQRVATGQADAFAATNEGKLLKSQIQVNEAMEKLGSVTLPIVAGAMTLVGDAAEGMSNALQHASGSSDDLGTTMQRGADAIGPFLGGMLKSIPVLGGLADAIGGADNASQDFNSHVGKDADDVAHSFDKEAGAATSASEDVVKAHEDMISAAQNYARKEKSAVQGVIDKAFDPLIAHNQFVANEATLSANRRILASKKASAAEKRDASSTVDRVEKENVSLAIELARTGRLSHKEQSALLDSLKKRWHKATGSAKEDLRSLIALIEGLPTNAHISIRVGGNERGRARAIGGPVAKGSPYIVGERGEELFVPKSDGTIIPHNKMGGWRTPHGMDHMGGATVVVQAILNHSGLMTPATSRDFEEQAGPAIANYLVRRGLVARV